ncbi:peptide-methionine (S)-S-oxide reductase MsrA [Arenibaculum pallidiluteum]|uniref:peptide-methionine (S)-S-oxide reductase MsrA n=1 Tax=Arenibaculum pallidiluteum TaxID=2812559 RepID=UPI001A97A85B|nr:peptide-methionine (S)-S-oxide reductase MsrA [Arenibaculum pallidiluteum]
MTPIHILVLALGLLAAPWAAPGAATAQEAPRTETAILAGGCFWCVESDFDKVPGVLETVSGFAGGHVANPTYRQVTAGGTGHREVVRVTFDPARVSFTQLVSYFWRTIDPVDGGGQFCDRGESYTTAIYATTPAQLEQAQASKAEIERRLGRKIETVVAALDAKEFFPAEAYHQNYHETHSLKYAYYRYACGRDARLEKLWGPAAGKWPPPADQPGS